MTEKEWNMLQNMVKMVILLGKVRFIVWCMVKHEQSGALWVWIILPARITTGEHELVCKSTVFRRVTMWPGLPERPKLRMLGSRKSSPSAVLLRRTWSDSLRNTSPCMYTHIANWEAVLFIIYARICSSHGAEVKLLLEHVLMHKSSLPGPVTWSKVCTSMSNAYACVYLMYNEYFELLNTCWWPLSAMFMVSLACSCSGATARTYVLLLSVVLGQFLSDSCQTCWELLSTC